MRRAPGIFSNTNSEANAIDPYGSSISRSDPGRSIGVPSAGVRAVLIAFFFSTLSTAVSNVCRTAVDCNPPRNTSVPPTSSKNNSGVTLAPSRLGQLALRIAIYRKDHSSTLRERAQLFAIFRGIGTDAHEQHVGRAQPPVQPGDVIDDYFGLDAAA